jgi:hypothetical protein
MSKHQSWDESEVVNRHPSSIPPIASNKDRRGQRRLNLDFETAVPVLVRSDDCMHWGLARNISEQGMLIQMQNPPSMGAAVDITLTGIRGSQHDSDGFELSGEVRHHLAWNYQSKGQKRSITAVGIRFCKRVPQFNPDRGGWVH